MKLYILTVNLYNELYWTLYVSLYFENAVVNGVILLYY